MPDLRQLLAPLLQGRVCLVGIGNVDYGDDGFGVRLAEALQASPIAAEVMIAGSAPERCLGRVANGGFERVIFLDAVDFGGAPGAVILLDARELIARFPQVSTHKLSLGLLARQIEAQGRIRVWLLGVQPESLKLRGALTPTIQTTLELLHALLTAGAENCRLARSESPEPGSKPAETTLREVLA